MTSHLEKELVYAFQAKYLDSEEYYIFCEGLIDRIFETKGLQLLGITQKEVLGVHEGLKALSRSVFANQKAI